MKTDTIARDKCGTRSGYQTHFYYNETYCEPCRSANSARFRQWASVNRESEQDRNKKNRGVFKDAIASSKRKRRAIQLSVESEPYTEADVLHLYGIECHICEKTIDLSAPRKVGVEGWEQGLHLDHVVALAKGGNDTLTNVKPSHGLCNIKKNVN